MENPKSITVTWIKTSVLEGQNSTVSKINNIYGESETMSFVLAVPQTHVISWKIKSGNEPVTTGHWHLPPHMLFSNLKNVRQYRFSILPPNWKTFWSTNQLRIHISWLDKLLVFWHQLRTLTSDVQILVYFPIPTVISSAFIRRGSCNCDCLCWISHFISITLYFVMHKFIVIDYGFDVSFLNC